MIVRHTENDICANNDEFDQLQKFKKWTFRHIPPHTKGGMKDVYDFLEEVNLEHYYKMIVHINTPMDSNLNDKGNDEKNNDYDKEYDNKNNKNKYKKKKKRNGSNNDNDNNESIKDLKYVYEYKNSVLIDVNVKPNAKETCIVKNESNEEYLHIRIGAAPSDGAANIELCKYIANIVNCSKSDVSIHKGHKSRDKCVKIHNGNIQDISNELIREINQ